MKAIVLTVLCSGLALCQESAVPFQIYRRGIVNVGLSKINAAPNQARWVGTGFLVDRNCTFATAKHVFAKREVDDQIVVRFQLPSNTSTARSVVTKLLFESPNNDLAFLKIDTFNNTPCQAGELHVFPLSSRGADTSLTGEPVWIIGHPQLGSTIVPMPVLRSGLIASTELRFARRPMLLLDLTGVPGFSGSPVILQRTGEVVGVVYGPGPISRQFDFEWATFITPSDYQGAKQPPASE